MACFSSWEFHGISRLFTWRSYRIFPACRGCPLARGTMRFSTFVEPLGLQHLDMKSTHPYPYPSDQLRKMETGLEMPWAGHHISIFQHHVIFQPAPYRSRLDVGSWSFSLLLRSWTSVWSFCWTLVQLLGSIGIYCYGMIGMFLSPCVP